MQIFLLLLLLFDNPIVLSSLFVPFDLPFILSFLSLLISKIPLFKRSKSKSRKHPKEKKRKGMLVTFPIKKKFPLDPPNLPFSKVHYLEAEVKVQEAS